MKVNDKRQNILVSLVKRQSGMVILRKAENKTRKEDWIFNLKFQTKKLGCYPIFKREIKQILKSETI